MDVLKPSWSGFHLAMAMRISALQGNSDELGREQKSRIKEKQLTYNEITWNTTRVEIVVRSHLLGNEAQAGLRADTAVTG